MAELAFDIEKTGLLIIDMQNAFCHPDGTLSKDGADISQIRETLEPLARLISACQAAEIQDFWSIQEHYESDATRSRHRIVPHTLKRFRVPSLKGTWDAEVVEDLKPLIRSDSEVFRKNRFGCFYNTKLETLLRIHDIDTLVVTGVTANACVDTTIREAYLRDFDVIVLRDCVGGIRRDWHEFAVQVWGRFMAHILESNGFIDLVRGSYSAIEDRIRPS